MFCVLYFFFFRRSAWKQRPKWKLWKRSELELCDVVWWWLMWTGCYPSWAFSFFFFFSFRFVFRRILFFLSWPCKTFSWPCKMSRRVCCLCLLFWSKLCVRIISCRAWPAFLLVAAQLIFSFLVYPSWAVPQLFDEVNYMKPTIANFHQTQGPVCNKHYLNSSLVHAIKFNLGQGNADCVCGPPCHHIEKE